MLLTGFFTGLSTGAGVLFSRYFGAKDYRNLHDTIHTALGVCPAFRCLHGNRRAILLTPLLLRVVDCPADVYIEAERYLTDLSGRHSFYRYL